MKLLIIEDDVENAAFAMRGFREHGHTIDHAVDGRDGLFLATENDYDVLIVDRMVPKMDGLSLLLILLSGYGLTHVLTALDKLTGTKDVNGGIKLGLTVGAFAIGFPIMMLMNLMGFTHVVLLVTFVYVVLVTILTNIVVIKLKHA